MVDWKKIFSPIENLFDRLWKFAGKSVQVLVAFMFMVFALGSLFGFFLGSVSNFRQEATLMLLIPPILGVLAYYYRTFATICFIAFLILILI